MELKQYVRGLRHVDEDVGEELLQTLESLKWYLWHGNVYEALYWAEDLEWAVEETEAAYQGLRQIDTVGESYFFRLWDSRTHRNPST